MVWFQCEDCGENLKKPKLINHFRGCSAQKLSCIDCGVVFNQQSVQGHTQCVSEAEKYGPKNMGCIKSESMKSLSKEQNCDGMDVSLGLSARAPWSCSLCNVKATSQETLMLHSQGKKHRSKVRATSSKLSSGNLASKNILGARVTVSSVDRKSDVDENILPVSSNDGLREQDPHNFKKENGFSAKAFAQLDDDANVQPESSSAFTSGSKKEQTERQQKKRKVDMEQYSRPSSARREAEVSRNETKASCSLMGVKLSEVELSGCGNHLDNRSKRKQKKDMVGEDVVQNWSDSVKWKKIIRRTLKNAPNGSLKIKQLRSTILPLVMEVAQRFDLKVSKESFFRELGKQIESHAVFIIDGKKVRLAVKDSEK